MTDKYTTADYEWEVHNEDENGEECEWTCPSKFWHDDGDIMDYRMAKHSDGYGICADFLCHSDRKSRYPSVEAATKWIVEYENVTHAELIKENQ